MDLPQRSFATKSKNIESLFEKHLVGSRVDNIWHDLLTQYNQDVKLVGLGLMLMDLGPC